MDLLQIPVFSYCNNLSHIELIGNNTSRVTEQRRYYDTLIKKHRRELDNAYIQINIDNDKDGCESIASMDISELDPLSVLAVQKQEHDIRDKLRHKAEKKRRVRQQRDRTCNQKLVSTVRYFSLPALALVQVYRINAGTSPTFKIGETHKRAFLP